MAAWVGVGERHTLNVGITSSYIHANYIYLMEGTGGSFGNGGAFEVVTVTAGGGAPGI